ncbi:MAG: carboxypeptidase-like regulatory domain-containing protein [Acidobacteria bacterium]|nr:carboxypeptidase-like regulatory domain-containing protein [Acidobacteriota bacterium]
MFQARRRSAGAAPDERTAQGSRVHWRPLPARGAVRTAAVAAALLVTGAGAAAGPSESTGNLSGTVTDQAGAPLGRVLVSASGPSGTTLVLGTVAGEFAFRALPPGRYLVRAHRAGFHASRLEVDVRTDSDTFVGEMQLLRAPPRAPTPPIRMAGAGLGAPASGSGQAAAPEGAAAGDPAAAPASGTVATRFWRLGRARRSVLKSRNWEPVAAVEADLDRLDVPLGRGPITDYVSGLPVTGEVQFLTRATLDGPLRWRSATGVPPGQIAYFAVTPTTEGEAAWAVRGAVNMTAGNASAWAVSGRLAGNPHDDHDLDLRISYSRQQYASSGQPARPLGADGRGRPSREVASIRAFDTWTPSSRVTVGYGADLAGYGYLEDGRLFSPRAHLTVTPIARTRVRVGLSRRMTAPGAEQFLPPGSGVWLPPERTFASLSGVDPLRAERTRHVEVALERDVGRGSTIEVRRFRQDIAGQMVTLFGMSGASFRDAFAAPGGHYRLASMHGALADGWGVRFSHGDDERLRGAIDYNLVRADWAPGAGFGGSAALVSLLAGGGDRFHDVTTTFEAEVPETATRILALVRISGAFARMMHDTLASGVNARFDVRVTQRLPFSPFDGSTWELLVALRSLFHDPAFGASTYDELLVVDAPPQLVGGLVVHF